MNTEIIEDLEVLEELNDTTNEVCIEKPKKANNRTEKQIIAFNLVIEKRNENRRQRALAKEKEQDEEKKALEAKIMKKAISIKKKEIKKQLVLDDISDDDEPVENIKKKIVKRDEREKKAVVTVPVMPGHNVSKLISGANLPRVIYM